MYAWHRPTHARSAPLPLPRDPIRPSCSVAPAQRGTIRPPEAAPQEHGPTQRGNKSRKIKGGTPCFRFVVTNDGMVQEHAGNEAAQEQ
jgi:hypothetical protein